MLFAGGVEHGLRLLTAAVLVGLQGHAALGLVVLQFLAQALVGGIVGLAARRFFGLGLFAPITDRAFGLFRVDFYGICRRLPQCRCGPIKDGGHTGAAAPLLYGHTAGCLPSLEPNIPKIGDRQGRGGQKETGDKHQEDGVGFDRAGNFVAEQHLAAEVPGKGDRETTGHQQTDQSQHEHLDDDRCRRRGDAVGIACGAALFRRVVVIVVIIIVVVTARHGPVAATATAAVSLTATDVAKAFVFLGAFGSTIDRRVLVVADIAVIGFLDHLDGIETGRLLDLLGFFDGLFTLRGAELGVNRPAASLLHVDLEMNVSCHGRYPAAPH